MASLRKPRNFVSSLISSLRRPDNSPSTTTTSSNPLSNATNETRKALLTLHVLFPNELLPALDLLDRNLVTRLLIQNQDEAAQQRPSSDPQPPEHQQPQPSIQRHEASQQLQTRRSQPRDHPHQPTLQQSSNVTIPNLRPVQPLDSRRQPPPGLQPSNTEREMGGLLRPIEDTGQLAVVGDSVREYPALEPPDRLREVRRQQEGQGEVWTQDQHRGSGETQGDERSHSPSGEGQHRGIEQAQIQLKQQHQATAQEQNPSPNPQGQTSREREILQHPQHHLPPSQPLRPEATQQEREASTSQIRDETSLPRSAHTEESPLRRRATAPTQSLAPRQQAQKHYPQNPEQTLRHTQPALSGSPRRSGDQAPYHESETGAGERQRRLRPQSGEGVYMVRSAQVAQSGARSGRQRGTGAAAQAWPSGAHYEVRVRAWSCSCPAFLFAAFPAAKSEQNEKVEKQADDRGEGWSFGGLILGDDMPVCKHLLACVLVEFGGLFKEFVEERVVSVEEIAGWAAGWGD